MKKTLPIIFVLALVIALSAWARETVTARIDSKCHPEVGKFTVPAGKTAVNFKIGRLDNGYKCTIGGKPDMKGFTIKQGDKIVYRWSQYKTKPPVEPEGPLSSLTLGPGNYMLSVGGGSGAIASIGYDLK